MPELDRELFDELKELLVPFMENAQARKTLLTQAFIGSSLLEEIAYEGPTQDFVIELIRRLSAYGEIESGKPALWALLETIRDRVGVDKQRRIDTLHDLINVLPQTTDIVEEDEVLVEEVPHSTSTDQSSETATSSLASKRNQLMQTGLTSKAVLTVDIVDFSLMKSDKQIKVIREFIKILQEVTRQDPNNRAGRIWSPAGDGGAITFWNDNLAALETAILLDKTIKAYNQTAEQFFSVRTGIHFGPVTQEDDFDGRRNIWGAGINVSARVAGLAKPGQILASQPFFREAELETKQTEKNVRLIVTYLGKWWVKHNKAIEVYNIYTRDGAGLPPSQVEEWYGPFHYPLSQAIDTYEAMLEEQAQNGPAFRAAVLSKRLLDLEPHHVRARTILESISRDRFPKTTSSAPPLYDVFFSELSPSALLHFFQNAKFRAFSRDEVIVEEGEIADSLMMVVSGEIVPCIGGKRLREPDPEHPEGEREIILQEGHITGEMGLFNPGGTRTATLLASKNTITLTLDYDFVRVESDMPPQDSALLAGYTNRLQIQRRIWKYYCERTIENKVYTHPLFQRLLSSERNKLNDNAEFWPEINGDNIEINVEELANYWIIVVAGCITIRTPEGVFIEYRPLTDMDEPSDPNVPSDCIGPVRLVITGEPPFFEIEIEPKTHLVCFPQRVIRKLLKTSSNFYDDAFVAGGKAKRRFGLI